jgi:S-adenosylmethionine:diacylglycerol 3-amino-3-carboxypropyl transferase
MSNEDSKIIWQTIRISAKIVMVSAIAIGGCTYLLNQPDRRDVVEQAQAKRAINCKAAKAGHNLSYINEYCR